MRALMSDNRRGRKSNTVEMQNKRFELRSVGIVLQMLSKLGNPLTYTTCNSAGVHCPKLVASTLVAW